MTFKHLVQISMTYCIRCSARVLVPSKGACLKIRFFQVNVGVIKAMIYIFFLI